MKKVRILSLLVFLCCCSGCFHVPEKDWLPSKNKTKIEEIDQTESDIINSVNLASKFLDSLHYNDEDNSGEESISNQTLFVTGDNNTIKDVIENLE